MCDEGGSPQCDIRLTELYALQAGRDAADKMRQEMQTAIDAWWVANVPPGTQVDYTSPSGQQFLGYIERYPPGFLGTVRVVVPENNNFIASVSPSSLAPRFDLPVIAVTNPVPSLTASQQAILAMMEIGRSYTEKELAASDEDISRLCQLKLIKQFTDQRWFWYEKYTPDGRLLEHEESMARTAKIRQMLTERRNREQGSNEFL